jgi:hypothetical protein
LRTIIARAFGATESVETIDGVPVTVPDLPPA